MATSAQPLASGPATSPGAGLAGLAGLARRARAAAATTPGRMRAVSLVVLVCAALAWAVGFSGVQHHQRAINTVSRDVAPVVVTSQNIQSLLSGADAAAANSFLAGGVEPADQRARYLGDLQQAQDQFAQAAAAGGAGARAALRTLAETAPTYAGLVESARANNRQGFPVGAGYLRRATALLHTTILPAAETVHQDSLARLTAGFRAASGTLAALGVVGTAVLLATALVAAQVFLRRRTNRVLNVGLVTGTVLALALIGWMLLSLLSQGSQVRSARDRADALNLLAQAQVTAFRAKSDESFALISRGNGAAQYKDFDAAIASLGGTTSGGGLLGKASSLVVANPAEVGSLNEAQQSLQAYLAAHRIIQGLDTAGAPPDPTGKSPTAVSLALASGPGSSNQAFDSFDAAVGRCAALVSDEFAGHMTSAAHHLRGVAIGVTTGFLAVVFLVLFGFQQRIKEYR